MEIAVDGWRASPSDWEAVRKIPREQLPPLTDAQREVARKLGFSEEDYGRSTMAGKRTQQALLGKTERLARLLAQRAAQSGARVQSVTFRVFKERFEVDLAVNGARVPLSIPEEVVDDYFERGSMEAEQALSRILERAVVVTRP